MVENLSVQTGTYITNNFVEGAVQNLEKLIELIYQKKFIRQYKKSVSV